MSLKKRQMFKMKSCYHFSNCFHEEVTLCDSNCDATCAHEIIFFSSNFKFRHLVCVCRTLIRIEEVGQAGA